MNPSRFDPAGPAPLPSPVEVSTWLAADGDGGCVFPGCSAPVERCQAHHLDPYELGGPTLLVNLAFMCSFHHHLVHEGRWRSWRTPDGQLHLVKPDRTYVPVIGHGNTPLPDQPPGTGPSPPPPLPAHRRMRTERDGPPPPRRGPG